MTYKIGTKIDVVMESGVILKCIMGDQKDDRDTDSTHSYHVTDGSYIEFIVSRSAIDSETKESGNFNCVKEFSGKIKEIRVQK